jgi:hypothetical protein
MKLDSVLIDMVQLDDHRNEYDHDAGSHVHRQNNMISDVIGLMVHRSMMIFM